MGEVQGFSPNMRFGTSFLNAKYKDRAVNDEVMMDKKTGELLWKRNTDGDIVRYNQENMHLSNYIQQMKALLNRWKETAIRPSYDNCAKLNETYFIASNISMLDFKFDESDTTKSVLKGSRLINPHPDAFSVAVEQNGFYINVTSAPRDRALISYLTALYDDTYRYYTGEDEIGVARRNMYGIEGYDHSHAMVHYTISYYTENDEAYNTMESTGFIRLNELTWVPFDKEGIYSRDVVAYAKVRITSIECPKLPIAYNELLIDDTRISMYQRLKEYEDVSFQTLQVSYYLSPTDRKFTMPSAENTKTILFMGWAEYEAELIRAKTSDTEPGIQISVKEPTAVQWQDLGGWIELNRLVMSDGTTESTGSETTIEELEKSLGSVSYHIGKFTENVENVDDYYLKEPLE